MSRALVVCRAQAAPDLGGYLVYPVYADPCVALRLERLSAFQDGNVRWAATPIAGLVAARDDVHVEVRHLLEAGDAVVLVQRQAVRLVGPYKRVGNAAHGPKDGRSFIIGKVEQRRRVPPWNDEHLPDLELAPVHDGQRVLCLLDDTLLLAPFDHLAEVAGVLPRQLKRYEISPSFVPEYRVPRHVGRTTAPRLSPRTHGPGAMTGCLPGRVLTNPLDHPPGPLPGEEGYAKRYLRDTSDTPR